MIPINKPLIEKPTYSVEVLEKKICEYTGAKYAITVNSATTGLILCLSIVSKITYGSEVIMPSYGHPAAFKACKFLGIKPIPVEMNQEDMSMDLDHVYYHMSEKTVAVINIETNGILGNLQRLKSLCESCFVSLIEDSASAFLQLYNGVPAGTYGDFGVYSFASNKVLNSGEGGVILTNDKELADELRDLRHMTDFSSVGTQSLNFQLSPFLVGMLLDQFKYLDHIIQSRETAHQLYKKYNLKIFEDKSVTNLYPYATYVSEKASAINEKLKKFKIGHRYQHYAVFKDLPIANQFKSSIIELPKFYNISEDQIKTICTIIHGVEDGRV